MAKALTPAYKNKKGWKNWGTHILPKPFDAKKKAIKFFETTTARAERRLKAFHERRVSYYKDKYGISLDEVLAIFEKQNYQCAICNATTELAVDHCHNTGKIRGGLCRRCNTFLGAFNDDISNIESSGISAKCSLKKS